MSEKILDPLGAGAAARKAGLGSWGSTAAGLTAPVALGNEARRAGTAMANLGVDQTRHNILTGATEFAKDDKQLAGLVDTLGIKAPPVHGPAPAPTGMNYAEPAAALSREAQTSALRAGLTDLQMSKLPYFKPARGMAGSPLDQFLQSQGSTHSVEDVASLLGRAGRRVNTAAVAKAPLAGATRFGGRALMYSLPALLLGAAQPDTAPEMPSSLTQYLRK